MTGKIRYKAPLLYSIDVYSNNAFQSQTHIQDAMPHRGRIRFVNSLGPTIPLPAREFSGGVVLR
jgi:hypothetical protein